MPQLRIGLRLARQLARFLGGVLIVQQQQTGGDIVIVTVAG